MCPKLMHLLIIASALFTSAVQNAADPCSSTELPCGDGECVSSSLVCDGTRHCSDGADELRCGRELIVPNTDIPNLHRSKRQAAISGCSAEQWQCRRGQCIPLELKCDGLVDCADGSDETVELCLNITLPQKKQKCILPSYPASGTYTANIPNAKPGDAYYNVYLTVTCRPEFQLEGPDVVRCQNGVWKTKLPKCVPQCHLPPDPSVEYRCPVFGSLGSRTCEEYERTGTSVSPQCRSPQYYSPVSFITMQCVDGVWDYIATCLPAPCPLSPHTSVEYRCLVSGSVEGSRACAEREPTGTLVRPQCRTPNYYSPVPLTYMRCNQGSWNYVAKCIPECGTVTPGGTELVIGGTAARRAEVPWHAAIYSKTRRPYEQVCGGSLISNNIVISAAHCFWDNFSSKQYPTAEYAVAVGKLFRPWNNSVDQAQQSDVKAIHLPVRFQGSVANYQDDIAVVEVATPFVYKTFIRPVCLDFDNLFEITQLQPGKLGKVAGWGLTSEDGDASLVLKVIDLPYVSTATCIIESSPDFRAYITGDKICAGSKDGTKALCKGDSGGGLAFPGWDRGVERHYLRGVVSTASSNQHLCNANTYTSFTQLLKHEHFIKQFWVAESVS